MNDICGILFFYCVIKIGIPTDKTFFFKFYYPIDVLRKLLWLLVIFLGDLLYSTMMLFQTIFMRQ